MALFNTDRIADEQELLLTTAMEVLSGGPASDASLVEAVNAVWVGAHIPLDRVLAAMQRGAELGLVAQAATLLEPAWVLTDGGLAETKATGDWYDTEIARLADQVAVRAADDFGALRHGQARLWAEWLVQSLLAGLGRLPGGYEGNVQARLDGGLAPIGLDARGMIASLSSRNIPEGTREFLASCILAAIDESDPFGNEIVTSVTTACVLTAIAARRARAGAQMALGTLSGERVVLDTPLLLMLLGTERDAERVQITIRQAVAEGMEVVVPEHVLSELSDVVERVDREFIPDLMSALSEGVNSRIFRNTVDDQVLELFLTATEEGRYRHWSDFRAAAAQAGRNLEALGAVVRPHRNTVPETVKSCYQALKGELERQGKNRGATQLDRDAHTMAMVWRARGRARSRGATLWPGGWVVTTDTRMAPAFAGLDPRDGVALTLTPTQWAVLVAEGATGPKVQDLVRAAGGYLRHETMLTVAMKYPPSVALTLARSLGEETTSETDTRVAQLSLGEMLDRAGGHPSVSGERLASEVMRRRSVRVRASQDAYAASLAQEREQLQRRVDEASAEARRERAERQDAAARGKAEADRASSLADELNRERLIRPRLVARATLLTLGLVAFLGLILMALWWAALGMAVSVLVFYNLSRKWAQDPGTRWTHLLAALIPEVIGIIDVIRGLAE